MAVLIRVGGLNHCNPLRPGGINILFPLSRPTLVKWATQKKFGKKIYFIFYRYIIFFHKINFIPPVLPIKKFFIRKGKHGIYFIWPYLYRFHDTTFLCVFVFDSSCQPAQRSFIWISPSSINWAK